MNQERKPLAQLAGIIYWAQGLLLLILPMSLGNGMLGHDQDNFAACCVLAMLGLGLYMLVDSIWASIKASDMERQIFAYNTRGRLKTLGAALGAQLCVFVIWMFQLPIYDLHWASRTTYGLLTLFCGACGAGALYLCLLFHQYVWQTRI